MGYVVVVVSCFVHVPPLQAVSTALGLGPCLYGCACAMRPIPSEVPGGERPVPPPPPPPLLSKADSSSSPGKVAQEGRDTEEDDPFAPVQTHKEASGLAPDPPPLAVPAPLRCCPLCLAKVNLEALSSKTVLYHFLGDLCLTCSSFSCLITISL